MSQPKTAMLKLSAGSCVLLASDDLVSTTCTDVTIQLHLHSLTTSVEAMKVH